MGRRIKNEAIDLNYKPIVSIFLILLLVFPASAYEDSIVSSTGTYWKTGTSMGSYYLMKTLTHTIDEDEYLDLYQIDFQMAHGTINTHTIYYKITVTPSGGSETTLLESSASVGSSSWVQVTRSVSFGDAAYVGDDVTVKIYMKQSFASSVTLGIQNAYSRGYLIPANPEITSCEAVTPSNDVTNDLEYSISGMGTASASLYVDDVLEWTGSADWGSNTIDLEGLGISQGSHDWYVNVSSTQIGETVYNETIPQAFVYDSVEPTLVNSFQSPDYEKIAVGTSVNVGCGWSDLHLEEVRYFVDYGSGFTLLNISYSNGWSNYTINTSDHLGNTITWRQIAYDEAGNSYTCLLYTSPSPRD
ncbi:hypothetical protein EO94_17905 [Methanosarcina sp. 2.H.T.1A.3]|nr:hypothetical protein EO94_17905 [Methanosarcina sp. 2.H.T.1A.3]